MVFLVNFIAIPTYAELMQEPIKNGGLLMPEIEVIRS